jgi:cell wall assembly regulator SMI1
MREIWQEIDLWLSAHAPIIFHSLCAGASVESVAETESALGIVFPSDVQQSVRIHDGQKGGRVWHPLIEDGWELLSLKEMVSHWQLWELSQRNGVFAALTSQPVQGIRERWWHSKWIPVATCHTGSSICLDLDPSPSGVKGQIIAVFHDDPTRHIVAPSWEAWLNAFAADLEQGRYFFSEEYAGLVRIDGPHA